MSYLPYSGDRGCPLPCPQICWGELCPRGLLMDRAGCSPATAPPIPPCHCGVTSNPVAEQGQSKGIQSIKVYMSNPWHWGPAASEGLKAQDPTGLALINPSCSIRGAEKQRTGKGEAGHGRGQCKGHCWKPKLLQAGGQGGQHAVVLLPFFPS